MVQPPTKIPAVVAHALQNARQQGFRHSALDEVGRLLSMFSGMKQAARIAEIGTGVGVGSAWLLSGMDSASTLITVEHDAHRALLAREIFAGNESVQVLEGDWKQILAHGPFDFVFVDARPAKEEGADLVIESLTPYGIILLDDFTPEEYWPLEWRGKPDIVREKWLTDRRLLCTEIRTSERNAVLLGRRLS